ncbi:fused response regulator/phosphatase [Actinomadura atramentaria]|uniref:fused response regulator/phosphatase n=1 Tax=Actinomadura atramentaria TaxID=1990 RepID=UPI0003760ED0|nr:fused response regulator/phosphatase [Actinomadura atramentaria]
MSAEEPITALVVDDNDTKRYIIGSWLRRAGHTVVEAASAAQTWRRLGEGGVDLVVLDVRLPDLSGVEVCERIKADPATAALPVVHISATAVDVADRTQGLRRGADAYLVDPIDPGEFLATVDAVLRYYRARRRAERMADRMAALTRMSLAVNAAVTFDRLADVAAAGAVEIFGVPVSVFLLPPDGRPRRAVGRPDGTERRASTPEQFAALADLTVLGDDTGTEVLTLPAARWRALVPDTVVDGDVALVLSRVNRGRPPICVAVHVAGAPGGEDRDLLRQLGQTLALAMEAMRSYTEQHLISLTLQRSLLPAAVPAVPGWTFAARYEPASDQAEVGGDFYEVLDRGDHVLVAIGDVQGHSLHAATVMAEIRHALRAFAGEGHDAETILRLLNGVLLRYHDDQTATVCLMTLEPETGALRVANAGHLPPLFLDAEGARYGAGGGVLLGFPVEKAGIEMTVVPPGGTVVLITDGLIEDRGVPLADNLERLRVVAARVDDDLERFCDRVIAEFGHREDDVALVVLRRDAR